LYFLLELVPALPATLSQLLHNKTGMPLLPEEIPFSAPQWVGHRLRRARLVPSRAPLYLSL
jgi:hypothetical protein